MSRRTYWKNWPVINPNISSYHVIIYAQRVYEELYYTEQYAFDDKEHFTTFEEARHALQVPYNDLLIPTSFKD